MSCLSLGLSNLSMLLSKATYSAQDHELKIAHLKAAWTFQHFWPGLFQTFIVVPAPYSEHQPETDAVVPFRSGVGVWKRNSDL